MQKNLSIFISYARKDEALLKEFYTHLKPLKDQKVITVWYDHDIPPTAEWERQIYTNLNRAQIILLLISARFLASPYCQKEMTRALERHRDGKASVIPIYLSYTLEGENGWVGTPFKDLQVLPRNNKPITGAPNPDQAFVEVVQEICKVAKKRFMDVAKNLSDKKRKEEALDALEQAILLVPEDANAYREKVKVLVDLKRNEGALTTQEQVIHLTPKDANAYRKKVEILLRLERNEEALATQEQVTRLAPKDANAYRIKVEILLALKRMKAALATQEEVIRLVPNDRNAYWEKVKILRDLNDLDSKKAALATLDQLRQLNSEDADVYPEKGRILLELNRKEEALPAFEQVIHLDPDDASAYYYKANILFHLERYKEAFAIYKQVLERTSDDRSPRTKQHAHSYEEAQAEAVRLIRSIKSTRNAAVYNIKGELLERLGYSDEALDAYNRAIEISKDKGAPNIDAYLKASSLLVSFGRNPEAVRLICSFTSNSAADYNKKGELLERLKSSEEALDAYKQAIKISKDKGAPNIDAYLKEGSLLVSLERYEEALAAYDQAIQLEPNNPEFYNKKGDTLRKLDRNKEALAVYKQVSRLDPYNVEIYRNLGELHHLLGEYEEALVVYEQAIRLKPDAGLYYKKGTTLRRLDRSKEAQAAYKQAETLEKVSPSYASDTSIARQGIREIQKEEHPRLYKFYLSLKRLSINSSNFWPYLTVIAIVFIFVWLSKINFLELLFAVFIISILCISIFTIILKNLLDG